MLLCFLQCAHRLQLLEVSITKPCSLCYAQEVRSWVRLYTGKVLIAFQIYSSLEWLIPVQLTCAVGNGLGLTGIWPPDRNIFLPVAVSHIALTRSHKAARHQTPCVLVHREPSVLICNCQYCDSKCSLWKSHTFFSTKNWSTEVKMSREAGQAVTVASCLTKTNHPP
jgi:hypothetical protein